MAILNIPQQKWADLARKKIFFGHMSIGYNIVSGLQELLQQQPVIKLNIVEIEKGQLKNLAKPVFAHSRVGGNEDPKSKIDAFVGLMRRAKNVDIAFFKLCYVDIHKGIDTKNLFTYYKSTMEKLAVNFPETLFVHLTTPLTSHQTGLKAFIKKMIGKPLRGANNRYREKYNEMIRMEYNDRGLLFDLALLEATDPNKNKFQRQASHDNKRALLPIYTEDGGHLNAFGSKVVSEQLLIFLATLKS